jgi:hypothetical protein
MGTTLTQRAGNTSNVYTVSSTAAVMANGDIIFTITGGPIQILSLHSECITVNDATASTMQWRSDPTVGTATTISAASASLASFAAGGTALLNPTSLATAPTLALVGAGGVQLGPDVSNKILVNAGVLELVIGVGSTTGTWKHFLRYAPLGEDTYVSAA